MPPNTPPDTWLRKLASGGSFLAKMKLALSALLSFPRDGDGAPIAGE
jgi:hypothetical protein